MNDSQNNENTSVVIKISDDKLTIFKLVVNTIVYIILTFLVICITFYVGILAMYILNKGIIESYDLFDPSWYTLLTILRGIFTIITLAYIMYGIIPYIYNKIRNKNEI